MKPSDMPAKISPLSTQKMRQVNKSAQNARRSAQKPGIKYVTSCEHVNILSVWCNTCAQTFLTQSRNLYAQALAKPATSDVIRAAKTRLTRALHEYALTPNGLASLEKTYANFVATGDTVEAEKLYNRIGDLRKEISTRNNESRLAERKAKSNSTTATSLALQYDRPQLNKEGKYTTTGFQPTVTTHAIIRMEERNINSEQMQNAFTNNNSITPIGSGKWVISGNNGVALAGFFNSLQTQGKFVVTTLYWANNKDDTLV